MSIEQQFSLCNLDHIRNTIKIKCDTTAQRSLATSATMQKSYGRHAYFQKRNTFLYDFLVSPCLANCHIRAIQMVHHKLAHTLAIAISITKTC